MKSYTVKEHLQRPDATDNIMDDIRMNSIYSSKIPFPDDSKLSKSDGIPADILYKAFKSPPQYSEFTAISQYTDDESAYDDISEPILQIAIIEMKHYDKLGDMIRTLGGDVNQFWDNSEINGSGRSKEQILEDAIQGEVDTIEYYTFLIQDIEEYPESPSRDILTETLSVIIEDEKVHKDRLTQLLLSL